MGALTALLGEKEAHACTIAVEDVIEGHYQEQIDDLSTLPHPKAQQLLDLFQRFKDEELEHKATAREEGGDQTPLFPLLYKTIQHISKTAIFLSKKR